MLSGYKINSLFLEKGRKYRERAQEGSISPCTQDVNPHVLQFSGISYNIYDSPGLQDGCEARDLAYLRQIKAKCPKIHLVIYCTKMGEPVRPAETTALKNLTSTFGDAIWENTVIALVCQQRTTGWSRHRWRRILSMSKEKDLHSAFERLSFREEIVDSLLQHIYPTGSARVLKLPGIRHDWRVDFWLGCLDACRPECKGDLLTLAWRVCSKGSTGLCRYYKWRIGTGWGVGVCCSWSCSKCVGVSRSSWCASYCCWGSGQCSWGWGHFRQQLCYQECQERI